MKAGNIPKWSQQLHGEAIRTQEMIAQVLCAIAQTGAHDPPAVKATQTLTTVQQIIDEILVHISQPHNVTRSAAMELTAFITELQQRTRVIQTWAGSVR